MLSHALKYAQAGYSVIPVKQDKVPYVQWEPFQKEKANEEQIRQWWKKWPSANIGLVTGEISDLFVIDADTPKAVEDIQDHLPEGLITPIQSTPRDGRHFFFKHIEGFSNRAKVLPGIDIRTTGGYIMACPSCNGEGKGWQWLDGLSMHEIAPAPLPSTLLGFIKEFAFVLYKGVKNEVTQSHKMFTLGSRNDDLFHIANQLAISRTPDWQIEQVLENIAINCKPKMSEKEINGIIKSALERAKRRDFNISQDLKLWVESQDGHFKVTEYHAESQIVTKEQKHAVIQALKRLQDEGIIEKYGDKRGVYRKIDASADEIDFMGTEEKVLDINWPFEIQNWVKILPKNIVIIAGESNAGKTAFLLSTCWLNMGKFKINYFSSEMGAMELRARLQKFEGNLKHWKDNVNFRERASNFADIVKPNDVNIIDFLEVTGEEGKEFYKVGGMISEIYNKLKKGIAVIALQKNRGKDLGLGAERSLEKARLYLTIEHGKIKIIKGKNWANPECNPNGMEWKFKLVQGAKFIIVEDKAVTRRDW